jgi:hypothetical protein
METKDNPIKNNVVETDTLRKRYLYKVMANLLGLPASIIIQAIIPRAGVRDEVLGLAGRYQEVAENLKVKEVWVEDLRYIVCYNPQEAAKDAADR